MTNRQQLSPAGYIINDDPLNTNPFFTFDSGEIDPSTLERIRLLENDVATLQDENNTNKQNITDNTEDISDLENEVISINSNINNLLTSVNGVTSDLRTLEDAVDDIVIDYVNTDEFTQFQKETTNAINSLNNLIGQANALLEMI